MPIMLILKSGHNFFIKAPDLMDHLRDLFSLHAHVTREHEQQHRMKVRKSAIISREYVPELEYIESAEKARIAQEEQKKKAEEAKKKADEDRAKRDADRQAEADKLAVAKVVKETIPGGQKG